MTGGGWTAPSSGPDFPEGTVSSWASLRGEKATNKGSGGPISSLRYTEDQFDGFPISCGVPSAPRSFLGSSDAAVLVHVSGNYRDLPAFTDLGCDWLRTSTISGEVSTW
jgi:hypothetical protein